MYGEYQQPEMRYPPQHPPPVRQFPQRGPYPPPPHKFGYPPGGHPEWVQDPYRQNGGGPHYPYPPPSSYDSPNSEFYEQEERRRHRKDKRKYHSDEDSFEIDRRKGKKNRRKKTNALEAFIKSILWGLLGILAVSAIVFSIYLYGRNKGWFTGFMIPFTMTSLGSIVGAIAGVYCCWQVAAQLYVMVMCICCMCCGCIIVTIILAVNYADSYSAQLKKLPDLDSAQNLIQSIQVKLSTMDETSKGSILLLFIFIAVLALVLNLTFSYVYREHLDEPISFLFEEEVDEEYGDNFAKSICRTGRHYRRKKMATPAAIHGKCVHRY